MLRTLPFFPALFPHKLFPQVAPIWLKWKQISRREKKTSRYNDCTFPKCKSMS
jgi:hypothetical protein